MTEIISLKRKFVNPTLTNKTCRTCGKEYPRTGEFFYKRIHPSMKDVFKYENNCIRCDNERSLKWKKENRDIKIKNNINNNVIILNSEILLKNSKLRQFGEYDKLAICIPCYQETKFDIKKFLAQQTQKNNIQLSDTQSEVIINSSSLKRSKIKEIMEKLNLYKNSGKITDQIIEEICTDIDLKKNDEIVDILLSKNEKNINEFISNMSNYEKNFIEIIIILRSFIIKILDIQKNNKNLSIDERIEKYKPPIFWKDKDRIKNILKIWSANNLEKFLSNLNIIETEFKRNDLNQDTQFYYFLTQNLSKISLKNTNNFI